MIQQLSAPGWQTGISNPGDPDPPPLPRARRKVAAAGAGGVRAARPARDVAESSNGEHADGSASATSRDETKALHYRRGIIERLLDHAPSLDESDSALLRSVYDNGLSATQLARALRQQPRVVRARVHRLIMRISSPAFQYVAREKDRWPPRRRQVAECLILRARTQRQTARELDITVHEVRKHLAHVTALMDAQ